MLKVVFRFKDFKDVTYLVDAENYSEALKKAKLQLKSDYAYKRHYKDVIIAKVNVLK